jgi:DNA-binding XRE family transcriptional regulator
MKTTDFLNQATMIAGISPISGNAVDQNMAAQAIAVFHQTLNQINNDAIITLWQEKLSYQDPNLDPSLFPDGTQLPFPAANSYPLPNDCRRVQRAFARNIEIRKTDYGEVEKIKRVPGMVNLYAINKGRIWLVTANPVEIIYAKQFPEYMPQDELTLPDEALDYCINQTALNIALAMNPDGVKRCQALAATSYNTLKANLSVNKGLQYQNSYQTFNRFSGRTGPWL